MYLNAIKPIITEYRQFRGVCTCCKQSSQAPLPKGVGANIWGPRAMAFVAQGSALYHLTRSQIRMMLKDSLGIEVLLLISGTMQETPLDYLLTSDVVADEIKQNIIREFKSEYDPINLRLYPQFVGVLDDITQEIDASFCEIALLGNGCSE
jgi:hypothetical protein